MAQVSNFITTYHRGDLYVLGERDKKIASFIQSELEAYASARLQKEQVWLECWAAYLGSPQADEYMRTQLLRTVGDVNNDWRHRINVGKAFENVETILSYLQQAFFPNRDWFDAIPTKSGYLNLATVVKAYTRDKLNEAKFISHWEMYIRQMLITGNSCIALPWRYETTKWKKRVRVNSPQYDALEFGERIPYKETVEERIIQNRPDFETLDIFDVYLPPKAADPNEGNLIRRLVKTRAEVAQAVKAGYFKNVNMKDITSARTYHGYDVSSSRRDLIKSFQGIDVFSDSYRMSDEIELFEFWGDIHLEEETIHDTHAIIMGDRLVRFETNPYWCGKPFVVGNYIPVVRSSMGIGAIEPSLGMLHEMNILTNLRLDNLTIMANSMFEVVNDGNLQPDDVFVAPGKVFSVTQQGTINPVDMGNNNFTVTYDEQTVLESRIDKNTGTGPMIGVGAGRSGERVTAQEIQATRDAGGNRLSGVHKHIEETSLLPCLAKCFRQIQQFVTEDDTVRIPAEEPGSYDYIAVGPDELQHDFKLMPMGADHVADKEYKSNQLLKFLQIASQYPEMQKHVDYFNIMVELGRQFGLDDIDRYIIEDINPNPSSAMQAGAPPQPAGMSGKEALDAELMDMGGEPMKGYVDSQINADGGADMLSQMFGVEGGDMSQLNPAPVQLTETAM